MYSALCRVVLQRQCDSSQLCSQHPMHGTQPLRPAVASQGRAHRCLAAGLRAAQAQHGWAVVDGCVHVLPPTVLAEVVAAGTPTGGCAARAKGVKADAAFCLRKAALSAHTHGGCSIAACSGMHLSGRAGRRHVCLIRVDESNLLAHSVCVGEPLVVDAVDVPACILSSVWNTPRWIDMCCSPCLRTTCTRTGGAQPRPG